MILYKQLASAQALSLEMLSAKIHRKAATSPIYITLCSMERYVHPLTQARSMTTLACHIYLSNSKAMAKAVFGQTSTWMFDIAAALTIRDLGNLFN